MATESGENHFFLISAFLVIDPISNFAPVRVAVPHWIMRLAEALEVQWLGQLSFFCSLLYFHN